MNLERLRAYIDLSRIHGTPIIIGIFLTGIISGIALSSPFIYIVSAVIIFFFKTSGSVLNDLTDFELDSLDTTLKNKPIQSGVISKRNAWIYLGFCFFAGLLLSVLFLPYQATILTLFALGLVYIYNFKGKFMPLGLELLFPLSMFILVIAGSYVAGGPNQITLLLAFMLFLTNVFAQWINSLRDIECDKRSNVGSIAVLDSFTHSDPNKKISVTYICGYILWIFYTFSLIWPFALGILPFIYIPLILIIHGLNTILIFKWTLKSTTRKQFNKILIYQVISYWVPIPIYLLNLRGIILSIGLLFFVLFGTILAILLEKGSQYKITITKSNIQPIPDDSIGQNN